MKAQRSVGELALPYLLYRLTYHGSSSILLTHQRTNEKVIKRGWGTYLVLPSSHLTHSPCLTYHHVLVPSVSSLSLTGPRTATSATRAVPAAVRSVAADLIADI